MYELVTTTTLKKAKEMLHGKKLKVFHTSVDGQNLIS